jgi:DNA (cytosine-5)-methyltransferase 1
MAENVKGLLSMNGGDAIRTIEKDFGDLGYHISTKLYHTANYGIPQSRERVVIVGTDKRRNLPKFEHPESTHSKEEWVTLGDAIGDLEKVKEGEAHNHFWSRAKMFPGTQGNSTVSKDKIGPTMRSEHHGNIEWHWNKKRRLSAREAARIQSFPDDFIFYPSTSGAYKQIGNAIAPVMAWHVAKAIEKFLDEHLTKFQQ